MIIIFTFTHLHPSNFRFKLGGLEFVKKFDEVSRSFLDTTRPSRHKRALAPEETDNGADDALGCNSIDIFLS